MHPLPQRFEALIDVCRLCLGQEPIVGGDDNGGMAGRNAREPREGKEQKHGGLRAWLNRASR